ncbi:type IV conjugative transfer system protein TraE [Ewingella americana]|nr:type IV conjugative transfer system protein TraE [Ewingella americana]
MELTARNSSNKIIAWMMAVLFLLLVLAMVSVILLAMQNRYLASHQKTTITPMIYNAPFWTSESATSPGYMQMMALSFLALRLNVSPETVEAQHAFLLSFVKPGAQTDFKVTLAEEARRIKESEVSSAFYQTQIKVYPTEGVVDVRGMLNTWIGNGKPISELKHYQMNE